jgi:thiol-disulfide isomerase/thioredoxin
MIAFPLILIFAEIEGAEWLGWHFARRRNMGTSSTDGVAEALASVETESGANLLTLAEASPVLLVFLRHFGCAFCRQAISDISELKGELDRRGVRPVFVHLGPPELAKVYFEYYGIGDVERVSDPEARIYRHPVFQLGRKHPLWQLVTPKVWWGWLKGAIFKHGIGKIEGDGHQMPGIFFLKGPKIVRRFIYKTVADEPDYLKLVR